MSIDKSVCLTGNLSEGTINYVCCPNEFSEKKWLLSIASVSYNSSQIISTTSMITCNFVTSKKRDNKGEVLVYEQPLNIFHLKTTAQSPKNLFRFCKD